MAPSIVYLVSWGGIDPAAEGNYTPTGPNTYEKVGDPTHYIQWNGYSSWRTAINSQYATFITASDSPVGTYMFGDLIHIACVVYEGAVPSSSSSSSIDSHSSSSSSSNDNTLCFSAGPGTPVGNNANVLGTWIQNGTYNGFKAYSKGSYWLWIGTDFKGERQWHISPTKGITNDIATSINISTPFNPVGTNTFRGEGGGDDGTYYSCANGICQSTSSSSSSSSGDSNSSSTSSSWSSWSLSSSSSKSLSSQSLSSQS